MACTCRTSRIRSWLKEAIKKAIRCSLRFPYSDRDVILAITKSDEVWILHDLDHAKEQNKFNCCSLGKGWSAKEFIAAANLAEGWTIRLDMGAVKLVISDPLQSSIIMDEVIHKEHQS